jgi:hypothetical protein
MVLTVMNSNVLSLWVFGVLATAQFGGEAIRLKARRRPGAPGDPSPHR